MSPQRIEIGHMADGTAISVEIPTLAEYLASRRPERFAVHEPEIANMSTIALEERFYELCEWHTGRAEIDPRCGCSADEEGGKCYWDDLDQIDDELARRG